MKRFVFQSISISIIAFAVLFCFGNRVQAMDTFPRLANPFLKYHLLVTDAEREALKKWDLLILPNATSVSHAGFIADYKRAKPDGTVIAYMYPAMAVDEPYTLYDRIEQENLWLRTASGARLEVWPRLYAANLSKERWKSINLDYVAAKMNEAPWDGIFYDTVEWNLDRHAASGIDITGDGQADNINTVNQQWRAGMADLFARTRQRLPQKLIMINGVSNDPYQPNINGRFFEAFPAFWEGDGSWAGTMYPYLRKLPPQNREPLLYAINANTANTGRKDDYRKMRFGLTSTLLGEGYYSFDFGDQDHGQVWWYDEYDIKLGRAESGYYNLLEPNSDYVKAGLWRRDFENGVSIVNSTNVERLFVFNREQFEKIRGTQDRLTNDGSTVNYVRLAPSDGIILRRVKQDVVGSTFSNGNFVRVFSSAGQQLRNGFFAYKADVTTNANVVLADLDGNGFTDRVIERGGRLIITGPGRPTTTIAPYGEAFKGKLSFAVYDFNNDRSKEIVVAPLTGGGPHVKVYSQTGRALSNGFFAFDKNFRGGVMLAAGDFNNDGRGEIIAAPGKDMAPTVKVLTQDGRLINSFSAYAKTFRGGVNVAIGDIDRDGKNEIVTGPNAGGPHVRIFDSSLRLKSQFMAFDPNGRTGVRVMVGDTDGDGKSEVLAGSNTF